MGCEALWNREAPSALTGKGIAPGLLTGAGVLPGDVDGGGGAAAVFVVGALVSLAVDVDLLAAAGFRCAVGKALLAPVAEASAAGFVRALCVVAHHLDIALAAALVFVVHTGHCGTV